ncbi:MAG TPA: septal ring lytic transglycosylase RlpA family protein [Nitrospira sp.]|nr:septal ring lytic transglycosylase RlpA family protein [Nitrospira sp.]
MCAPGTSKCIDSPALSLGSTSLIAAWLAVLSFFLGCSSPAPKPVYFPGYPIGYVERGTASWYGPGFHGNKTANGERYDMHKLTAAHRTLPLGSIAVVRSVTTGKEVTVRINDRGPFAKGRVMDLSYAGARTLGMVGNGTDQVELRVIGFQGRTGDMGFLRVQIGSFAEQTNAVTLLARARRMYPEGRIQTVDLPDGRRYRVQVGEFRTENQAESAATRLEADLAVQSFVFRDDN